MDGGFVVPAVPKYSEASEDTIRTPHRSCNKDDNDFFLVEFRSMHCEHDDDEHIHGDMNDVEGFVSQLLHSHCSNKNGDHGADGDYAENLLKLDQFMETVGSLEVCRFKCDVEKCGDYSGVASDLVERVETFVGVSCQVREWCVLQCQEC